MNDFTTRWLAADHQSSLLREADAERLRRAARAGRRSPDGLVARVLAGVRRAGRAVRRGASVAPAAR